MDQLKRAAAHVFDYSGIALLAAKLRRPKGPTAVFLWIPKTAGTSLYSVLARHGCHKLKKLHQIRLRFANKGFVTFGHMDYAALVRNGYVSREFDRVAVKFAVCRNPYDRAVSLFAFNKHLRKIPEDQGFLDFCRGLARTSIEPIGLHHARGLSQCNPQVRWLENTRVDFVGRYENLQADTARLLELLRLPASQMPHLNATRHQDYRDYYCAESREIVQTFYAEDFAHFGYSTTL